MEDKDGRRWLFTRMAPDIFLKIAIFISMFGGIFIWGTFFSQKLPGNAEFDWFKDLGIGVLVIVCAMVFLIWLNKTYTISYDADAVYMGRVEWRWRQLGFQRLENAMRFDEIAELGAGQADGISPIGYIAFRRHGGDWEEKFFVSRYQLRDVEIREFARHMYTKIPEKFPPELLKFLN